ncbi:piwi-like protein Siwi isoform X2 [Aethina tumida]|nr:piwi-like protein Siwi isoform X2 [Aethina tumida]
MEGVRGRPTRNPLIRTKPDNFEKKGTSGVPLKLHANYFEMLSTGKWCLTQYRVDFNPEVDNTKERRSLLYTALKDTVVGYIFDGTVMSTPQVIHPDPLEKFVENKDGEKKMVTIRRVAEVSWGDYSYIQVFNIIIRKCSAYLKLEMVGRDFFDPHEKTQLNDHNIEIWPGYRTSIRQHEQQILLNTELAFKVIRTDTVLQVMMEYKSREDFMSRVIGTTVLTEYNNKTYHIDDIDFESTPCSTFTGKDNKQISFIQYYKDRYNIEIRNKNQPLLISRAKAREIRLGMSETVLLVPELCRLTGLTDRQRENFQLMRSMANITRLPPKGRIERLMRFCQRLRNCNEAMHEIRRWDLEIADKLVELPARLLTPESLLAGENRSYSAGQEADWTRELRSVPMYSTTEMKRLAVICPSRLFDKTEEFMTCLQRAGGGMRWNLKNFKIFPIPRDDTTSYLSQIDSVLGQNPTIIICILASASADRYSAIKKKCYVDRGVPSQVILAKTLTNKGVMSIATKVAIQLNCKIGGIPWSVHIPVSGLMVVGYDVCRDTTKRGKSYGAMVATLNRSGRYVNFVTEHSAEEELSHNFGANLILACRYYANENGHLPKKFIIYRDGVGDGQLPYVIEQEVGSIKKRLIDELYMDEPAPGIAFIVVSKRINTRVFHRGENPPPGTVIDDVITLPHRYDFFIVSQCVRQGTVSPTSYNVISDTLSLQADRMQMLTYKMCHMYYNWSGTVRVPAPCQYAHKLAFCAAKFLHRQPHRNLANVLYYL